MPLELVSKLVETKNTDHDAGRSKQMSMLSKYAANLANRGNDHKSWGLGICRYALNRC